MHCPYFPIIVWSFCFISMVQIKELFESNHQSYINSSVYSLIFHTFMSTTGTNANARHCSVGWWRVSSSTLLLFLIGVRYIQHFFSWCIYLHYVWKKKRLGRLLQRKKNNILTFFVLSFFPDFIVRRRNDAQMGMKYVCLTYSKQWGKVTPVGIFCHHMLLHLEMA